MRAQEGGVSGQERRAFERVGWPREEKRRCLWVGGVFGGARDATWGVCADCGVFGFEAVKR